MIQGKVWGNTAKLFEKNNVEIHRIEIKKGGYCSKHRHVFKYNAFYVERGKLKISIWKLDYDLCDKTVIEGGEMTIVLPGEYHRFKALDDTIAYEIYWVELDAKDIERKDCGSCK